MDSVLHDWEEFLRLTEEIQHQEAISSEKGWVPVMRYMGHKNSVIQERNVVLPFFPPSI
jgi:hypothetical protein